MPIQLDKILADIAEEKALHPNFGDATKQEIDDAWSRVGKCNTLSVHEARSIFKVLQKKYEQEKCKSSSSWKLFNIMEEIHQKELPFQVQGTDVKQEDEDSDVPMEEDEEYEMLEVHEDEDGTPQIPPLPSKSCGSISDAESPTKSAMTTPEKEDIKPLIKGFPLGGNIGANKTILNNIKKEMPPTEEKKLLNTMASATPRSQHAATTPSLVTPLTPTSATAAALHKKGIIMKKTTPQSLNNSGSGLVGGGPTKQNASSLQIKNTTVRGVNSGHLLEVGKTIQLPESIKRKLSEDQGSTNLSPPQIKKIHVGQQQQHHQHHAIVKSAPPPPQSSAIASTATPSPVSVTTSSSLSSSSLSHDQQNPTHGINIITIPGNPIRSDLVNGIGGGGGVSIGGGNSTTVCSTTSTNGFPSRIEDFDFRNDIIFDTGTVNGSPTSIAIGSVVGGTTVCSSAPQSSSSTLTTTATAATTTAIATTQKTNTDIINLGNFDNTLPPTFFKNLCNSSRHEAFGLYVANVMNRLRPRSASKLELGILRAIIDVQTDELD